MSLALENCGGVSVFDAKTNRSPPIRSPQHRAPFPKTRVSGQKLVRFALAHLEELDLSGTQVTDSGLDHLSDLSVLATLNLSDTFVTDAGLQALQHLSQLKSLYLDHTQISEAGLAHISALVQLDALRLDHTLVNDAGLQHLSRLPRLRYLSLQGTRITGHGLRHLMGSSKLRYLLLPEDIPHREELRRLHQAIPDCWIYLGNRFWLTQPLSDSRGQGEKE